MAQGQTPIGIRYQLDSDLEQITRLIKAAGVEVTQPIPARGLLLGRVDDPSVQTAVNAVPGVIGSLLTVDLDALKALG